MDAEGIAREWIDAYNAGDEERLAACMTPDMFYEMPFFGYCISGNHRVATLGPTLEFVPDRRFEVRRIIGCGNHAIAEFLWTGTSSGQAPWLPPAGEPVEALNVQIYDINDEGLITGIREYSGSHKGFEVVVGPNMQEMIDQLKKRVAGEE